MCFDLIERAAVVSAIGAVEVAWLAVDAPLENMMRDELEDRVGTSRNRRILPGGLRHLK